MPLTYLHPGDLDTGYLIFFLLLMGLVMFSVAVAVADVLVYGFKAAERKIAKKYGGDDSGEPPSDL